MQTKPQLILLGRFAGTHRVPQRFVGGIRNLHGSQLAGTVTAGQLLCIPEIGLDPILCLGRNQAGRDHLAGDAQLRQLPVEHVAGWPRLVTSFDPLGRAQVLM